MRLYLNGVLGDASSVGTVCAHGRRRGWHEEAKRAYVDCPECVALLKRVYPGLTSHDPYDTALETVEETRRREALERERQGLVEAALRAGAEKLVQDVLAGARRQLEGHSRG